MLNARIAILEAEIEATRVQNNVLDGVLGI